VTAVAVPVLGLGFLLLINQATPGALDRMTGSVVGQFATIIAFALYGIGLFLIRRMSAVRV
jgi:tight adherence protein B